jgi:hypothetical protein
MASGHVIRTQMPDRWLHRPMLQNVKKVLANPEPSTHGHEIDIASRARWPVVRDIERKSDFESASS